LQAENSFESQLTTLKDSIAKLKDGKVHVTAVSAAPAKISGDYAEANVEQTLSSFEKYKWVYLLRRCEDGKWRIYGWRKG
jgi:hypothetical protein